MARYRTTVESTRSQEEAFAYLADFANAHEWDPGVVEGERLDAHVGRGSRFRIVAGFLGRRIPIEYRITEYEPSRRVVLEADEGAFRSVDEIRVSADAGGCEVTYDADLRLKGPFGALAEPLLALAFRRIGDRATAGLRDTLNR